MDHPVMPEGQVAGRMADIIDRRPEVWEQALPRDVPLFVTRALVQEPGKGPHRPGLEEATKRERLTIPTGHVEGIVPVKALDPRLSCVKAPRVLQDEGRVPVRWLLAMERTERRVNADQARGKVPLNVFPGSFNDCKVWTSDRL